MQQLIDKTLARVFKDFKASVAKCKGLCELKTLTYEGGTQPDYTNPFIQQYYMLRYFPAYLFEYYTIYNRILSQRLADAPLNVLSVGAGCLVDYYGLHCALRTHAQYAADLRYTGLDVVPWAYQHTLGRAHVCVIERDIEQWAQLDETTYNLIILPKSIGEFPSQTFTHLKHILRDSTFDLDRVCLACSLMQKGRDADVTRFVQLVDVMKRHHRFTCNSDPNEFWSFKRDQGIRAVQSDWIYPDEIKTLLGELLGECPQYTKTGKSCSRSCEVLNRQPILTTGYIAYQVIGLVRE